MPLIKIIIFKEKVLLYYKNRGLILTYVLH